MVEETGLENEFEYDPDEILDLIANGAGGKDADYPNRPGTGADDRFDMDAEGNVIDPNRPGVDNVTARYAEWVEEAEAYGVENLTIRDQVLYAQAGFRSGKLTAEEAQAIYDPAYDASMEAFGYAYDDEKGQWYDEGRLNDTFDGGEKGVKDWYTAIDFSNANTGFDDFDGNYINAEWDMDREIINTSFVSNNFKMGIAIGASLISGGAASGFFGSLGWGTIASGAASGAVGSAVSGAVMGDITLEGLVTGAIMGGIGGWADTLGGMEGVIMDSEILSGSWDFVDATADLLRVDFDTALGIIEGVAKGAVSGGELKDIIAGAVVGWGTEKTQQFLQGVYGDELNVADWFKDGESNIPVEALNPFIEGAWNAAVSGKGDMGDLAKMLWDYHQEGGDLDFILPPGVDLGGGSVLDWIDAQLPDVTINWDSPEFDVTFEEGLGEDEGFEEEEKDKVTVDIPGVDIDIPDVDVDINIPEVKCPTGERWSTNLSKCIPDVELPEVPELPDVIECMEGFEWSDILEKCVEIPEIPEVPDVIECMEGFQWDDILKQCVEIPEVPDVIECMEGFEWSDVLEKCVEIPEVPDAVECMEGFQWDDLLGKCIEIPEVPDVVECVEGFEWSDVLEKCVEIDFGDDEEEIETEDTDVETEGVDLPEGPSGSGGPSPSHKTNPQGLFDYINISPQQAAQLTPYVDYIQQARGMLS